MDWVKFFVPPSSGVTRDDAKTLERYPGACARLFLDIRDVSESREALDAVSCAFRETEDYVDAAMRVTETHSRDIENLEDHCRNLAHLIDELLKDRFVVTFEDETYHGPVFDDVRKWCQENLRHPWTLHDFSHTSRAILIIHDNTDKTMFKLKWSEKVTC